MSTPSSTSQPNVLVFLAENTEQPVGILPQMRPLDDVWNETGNPTRSAGKRKQ